MVDGPWPPEFDLIHQQRLPLSIALLSAPTQLAKIGPRNQNGAGFELFDICLADPSMAPARAQPHKSHKSIPAPIISGYVTDSVMPAI